MAPPALFRPTATDTFAPTEAALGALDDSVLHDGAVAALVTGRLALPGRTLGRLLVEIVVPVPRTELVLEVGATTGGSRVTRRDATLLAEGRVVATARALDVRRSDVDLPAEALPPPGPFDPDAVPPLDAPDHDARTGAGRDGFERLAGVVVPLHVPDDPRAHQWVALAVPVVEDEELLGVETAAVGAVLAQAAVSEVLPDHALSLRRAELTVHMARPPEGRWVGVRSDAVLQPYGAGFASGELFDEQGHFGRSAAAVVIEEPPQHG